MTRSYRVRRAEALIGAALADTRVVAVNGARQCGKSTLVHEVLRGRGGTTERRLDRGIDRAAAAADPDGFVQHAGLMAIDEVQRVPELLLAVKAAVDADPRPGQFLLTGSARLLGLRTLPDALVGRMETVELWTFSQGEIDDHPDRFVDWAFSDDDPPALGRAETRADLVDRALRGGFPEAVTRAPARRARFFESYLNDLIDRDVIQLAEIERRHQLHDLVAALGRRMAQPLSVERVAQQTAIPSRTLARYLALFEEVFLIKRVQAWSGGSTRALQMPKLLFTDSGLGADVAGLTAARADKAPDLLGQVVENFVLGELARQCSWNDTRCRLLHYRTKDGVEVDGLLEARDGRVVGVEVKAALTVRDDDFAGLRHLQRRVPDRFVRGVVLYAGTEVRRFGAGLWAVPIPALWHAAA